MIVDKNTKNFTCWIISIKAIDPGFTEKNNSVSYLNNVELIKVLQKGLDLLAMPLLLRTAKQLLKFGQQSTR